MEYCNIQTVLSIFYGLSLLLAMLVNTLTMFDIVYPHKTMHHKVLVILAITILHFAFSSGTYFFPVLCNPDSLVGHQISVFVNEWSKATASVNYFLTYTYDTLCVVRITVYLFSLDKKHKNSPDKAKHAIQQTLLDRGTLFTIVSQITIVFVKVTISTLINYTLWPGSDKGFETFDTANFLILALHICISSYSHNHFKSILRKALHKKAVEKPKMKLGLGKFWKQKVLENLKSSRTYLSGSKHQLNKRMVTEQSANSPRPQSPNPESLKVLDSSPKESQVSERKNMEMAELDVETVKIPRKTT